MACFSPISTLENFPWFLSSPESNSSTVSIITQNGYKDIFATTGEIETDVDIYLEDFYLSYIFHALV